MTTRHNCGGIVENIENQDAFSRAVTNNGLMNYPAIFSGFLDKGISKDEIKPRENVFTYKAWLHQQRQVRKGEHGVKVTTFIQGEKDVKGKTQYFKFPRTPTVFHVSQTDPV